MTFKLWMLLPALAAAACSNSDTKARKVLSEAEKECGLPAGTLKFMGVNELYDEASAKPSGKKVIYVTSQPFERVRVCVDRVAQANGYDRVMRFVTY